MTQYLLHVTADLQRPRPSWQENLFSRDIVVRPVRSISDALQFCKIYQVILLLVELDSEPESLLHELESTPAETVALLPPMIGLASQRPGAEVLSALARAGLVDVLTSDDPESFILWRLDLLRQLADLRQFEKSRMDVGELAKLTRAHLHDMSQPLSAVQGRLQLMAAKCPPGDPNAQTYQDLVRLAFDITHQIIEIQQLHRQFS